MLGNGSTVDDCDMHVNAVVRANHMSYFVVEYNSTVDIRVDPSNDNLKISNSHESLSFIESDDTHGVVFEL